MAAKNVQTPIRAALNATSVLQQSVNDGIAALKGQHRQLLSDEVRRAFADSLNLDAALQEQYPNQNRWDYLLGHRSTELVGLEPHSARTDQITGVIGKKDAAFQQLRPHLRDGKHVARWLWVASGKVGFVDTEKARRRLDQHGIQFVGRCVRARHLS